MGPRNLNGNELEVQLEILTVTRGRINAGSFGAYQKPTKASSKMVFFLPERKKVQQEFKALGMTACAHGWPYVTCIGYWSSMAKLATKMSRDKRTRKLGCTNEDDLNVDINVWFHFYSEIAGMVADYRGSFMRLALGPGKPRPRLFLKFEADTAVGELVVGDMQKLKTD